MADVLENNLDELNLKVLDKSVVAIRKELSRNIGDAVAVKLLLPE
jgi:hypothetical protein